MALSRNTQIFEKKWFSSTPQNAAKASATLTFSGVAIDGETVTIGDDTYEFAADAAQGVTSGNIAVNIQAYATKAQGTLTVDTLPTATDTMTIGDTEYTFVASGDFDTAGEKPITAADLAATQASIVAAINGTDSVNSANASASAAAFASDDCVITALVGGTAGNSIASTEAFAAETNVFDATTLGTTTAGTDCSAANAVTALVAAITTSDTQNVGAADGTGDTVVATYDYVGTGGNSVTVSDECSNATWGAEVTTLSGGQYATPAKCACMIEISGTVYLTYKGGDKYKTDLWYSATPTVIS